MAAIADYIREIVRSVQAPAVDPSKIGDCPCCRRPVVEGKRDFGCSGWREGCSFVLRREYKGHTLSLAEVRELVQQRVLLSPLRLPGGDEVILVLTDSGVVVEIPPPRANATTPRKSKRRGAASRKHKSHEPRASDAAPPPERFAGDQPANRD